MFFQPTHMVSLDVLVILQCSVWRGRETEKQEVSWHWKSRVREPSGHTADRRVQRHLLHWYINAQS